MGMQVYVERGVSKGDCLQKIVSKYGIRFTVLREKTYRPSGIRGLFSPEGVELEFCLSPLRSSAPQETETYTQLPGEQAPPRQRYASDRRDDSTLDFVEAKKRVLAAAGKNPEQVFQQVQEEEKEAEQLILDKLRQIEEKIATGKEPKTEHPSLVQLLTLLRENDFSERYTAGILERSRKELPLEILEDFNAVQDRVLHWIGESIKIFPIPELQKSGRVMVLIGPTGVGKTTTVAKLAAKYGPLYSGKRPISIRMITIDAYKIGAKAQLEDYGDVMEIPVAYIDNRRDLRREIDLYREDTDLILVDTIGRSPRDSAKLGEMKELVDVCGSKAEVHLALSASTKTSDMEHILQQFEPFNYQAVVLTKLDETRHIGNVISALAERGKPVSYITDGQEAHKNISKASVIRFLINLDEFRVDREEIEKRFPIAEANQFQWGN
ncbi:MAG: flagellar biosynthesis protein FlhF [Treponema sp.]|jgi:flagellar biosynthesis protein FlhF|nr:flagellar biosynthesis protein FlhF [Treponema sp.]